MNATTAAAELEACLADAMDTLLAARPDLIAWRAEARRCAQLFADLDRTRLVVGLYGGTGVGKSTLINALAGATISRAGERRPTTDRIVCHRHRDASLPEGIAESELAEGVPPHDAEALRHVVLLDLPDIDGHVRSHAERVARVLPRLDALIVTTSVDKYADRTLYDALKALPQATRNLVFVLNAIDRLAAADRPRVLEDFRDTLAKHGGVPDASPFGLSARDASSLDEQTRAASGLAPLRLQIEALGSDGERRRILLANAEATRARVREALDVVLPAATVDAWLARLEAIPARGPTPPADAILALREALERELAPALSRRARRASGFPIFELDALTRWLRPQIIDHQLQGEPAAARAFQERWLDRPLALAASEAAWVATPPESLPFLPLRVPCAAFNSASDGAPGKALPSTHDLADTKPLDAPFARWQTGLARRAAGRAWRIRQHVGPFVLACGALLAAAAPLLAHALDPAASGAAGAPSLMLFVDRLGALRWGWLLAVVAAWYAIVPLRFERRLARACDAEARAGAAALAEGLQTGFDARFGSAWRAEVERRRRFVDEVRRCSDQLARVA